VSQRACHFLVALLLIFSTKIFSQQQLPRIAQNRSHELKISRDFQQQYFGATFGYRQNELIKLPYNEYHYYLGGGNYAGPSEIKWRLPAYTSHLPFFCKKELQFENSTSIPLRFRVGSLEYVNKMEGKQ